MSEVMKAQGRADGTKVSAAVRRSLPRRVLNHNHIINDHPSLPCLEAQSPDGARMAPAKTAITSRSLALSWPLSVCRSSPWLRAA